MAQKFPLNDRTERAAHLLAAGKSIVQVAKALAVDEKTVDRWKLHPEFISRIEHHRKLFAAGLTKRGRASKNKRITAKRRRIRKLNQIIRERAKHEMFRDVPGGKTGYLTRTERSINIGDGQYSVVADYELDSALLREIDQLEQDIAIEKGEWKNKIDHSGKIDLDLHAPPEVVAFARAFLPDELEDMKRRLQAASGNDNDHRYQDSPQEPEAPGPA